MRDSRLQALITCCQASRVIAVNKQRHDLAAACLLKISGLQALHGFNPSWVAGVEHLERDCRDAITMAEVRARYARFNSGPASPCVSGEPAAYPLSVAGSASSKRKAA